MSTIDTTTDGRRFVSDTQLGRAFDCRRSWHGVYRLGLRPFDRPASMPMRVGKIGHLRVEHHFAQGVDGLDWPTRLARLAASENFRVDPAEEDAALAGAERAVARLAGRVPLRAADGSLLVETMLRADWSAIGRVVHPQTIPPLVRQTYAGVEGRIDLADGAVVGLSGGVDEEDFTETIGDFTLRDFKFTQKPVSQAGETTSDVPDRQLAVYSTLCRAHGIAVERFVQTVVFAGPMLSQGDLTDPSAPGRPNPFVRADGLPSRTPHNVDPRHYGAAWDVLVARRAATDPRRPEATEAERLERDDHLRLLASIPRVVDRPYSMSWPVARDVFVGALWGLESALRDERSAPNFRTYEQSPCRRWCDMREACMASVGRADFDAVAHDLADRGVYETREQRARRLAAQESRR